jgi:hypothetical protein
MGARAKVAANLVLGSAASKPQARTFWSHGKTELSREASINSFVFRALLRECGRRHGQFTVLDHVVFLQLLPHK